MSHQHYWSVHNSRFVGQEMSAARLVSLRESLAGTRRENKALTQAIGARVRQQRPKPLPLQVAHVVWVIYALATAPTIILTKFLKSANVRRDNDEDLLWIAEESFLRADLQRILDVCDERASTDRSARAHHVLSNIMCV